MKLGKILKRLAVNELRSLAISEEGQIRENDREAVIAAINSAMSEIYTRFNFREKTLLIEQVMNITEYKLLPKYAFSNKNSGDELHYFIMDSTSEPYTGDLVKILSVWDDMGNPLKVNDIGDPCSLYTPYPDTLLIQRPIEGKVVSITYQSLPDEIPLDADDEYEFDLPRTMETAISSHVSMRLFIDIGTQEAIAKGQIFQATFENQCIIAQQSDSLSVGVSGTGTKFQQRGFV